MSTWTPAGLYRLQWIEGTTTVPVEPPVTAAALDLDRRLRTYFAGRPASDDPASDDPAGGVPATFDQANFGDVILDTSGWTPLQERLYQRCREIPAGATISYKELASRAGNPAASRAAGAAMARNRVVLVIPCHRVVASDGSLRGYSAPGGLDTKRSLLELESA